jgi:hypothetical protein
MMFFTRFLLNSKKASPTRLTDELGEFALPVIVHDTDSIGILIEAQGYISCEERLVGVELYGGRSLDVGLSPLLSVEVAFNRGLLRFPLAAG